MIEGSKVIEEVDPALEHSFVMPSSVVPVHSIPSFSSITRDVDKLISRLSHQRQSLSPFQYDNNQPTIQQLPQESSSFIVGRYNYTGRAYRFQQAERQLNISPPEVKQECRTQQHLERHPNEQMSVRSDGFSRKAEQSLNQSQIKFPSHDYYIMFDKKKSSRDFEDKFKSMYLEKKVDQLENQVKKIKAMSRTTSTNLRVRDGKMKLDRLLDSILG